MKEALFSSDQNADADFSPVSHIKKLFSVFSSSRERSCEPQTSDPVAKSSVKFSAPSYPALDTITHTFHPETSSFLRLLVRHALAFCCSLLFMTLKLERPRPQSSERFSSFLMLIP